MTDNKTGRVKVLIIDDDDLIRLTCRNILKKADYDVYEAENGVSGMDTFAKQKPDIVITDILMPDKEGLETIRDIRATGAAADIIAMSSGGSVSNMSFLKIAEKVGADRLLVKPFKPDELLACIQSLRLGQ